MSSTDNQELANACRKAANLIEQMSDWAKVMRYWWGWIDADEYCQNQEYNAITGKACSDPHCEGCRMHDLAEKLLMGIGLL